MQKLAPHTQRRGKGIDRQDRGKAGPSSSRQACWKHRGAPKEWPPHTGHSVHARHCVHCLMYVPGSQDRCFVHFTEQRVGALRGSGICLRLPSRSEAEPGLNPGSVGQSHNRPSPIRENLCRTGASPRKIGQLPPPIPSLPQPSHSRSGIWVPRERSR